MAHLLRVGLIIFYPFMVKMAVGIGSFRLSHINIHECLTLIASC